MIKLEFLDLDNRWNCEWICCEASLSRWCSPVEKVLRSMLILFLRWGVFVGLSSVSVAGLLVMFCLNFARGVCWKGCPPRFWKTHGNNLHWIFTVSYFVSSFSFLRAWSSDLCWFNISVHAVHCSGFVHEPSSRSHHPMSSHVPAGVFTSRCQIGRYSNLSTDNSVFQKNGSLIHNAYEAMFDHRGNRWLNGDLPQVHDHKIEMPMFRANASAEVLSSLLGPTPDTKHIANAKITRATSQSSSWFPKSIYSVGPSLVDTFGKMFQTNRPTRLFEVNLKILRSVSYVLYSFNCIYVRYRNQRRHLRTKPGNIFCFRIPTEVIASMFRTVRNSHLLITLRCILCRMFSTIGIFWMQQSHLFIMTRSAILTQTTQRSNVTLWIIAVPKCLSWCIISSHWIAPREDSVT